MFDPEEERDFWLTTVRWAAKDPFPWLVTARGLRRSAEVLWSRYITSIGPAAETPNDWHCLPPALMLAGYALENYAKALVIRAKPHLVASDGLAATFTRGHPLHSLLSEAHVELSDAEHVVIHRLTNFVRWAGRYPVPKNFEAMVPIAAGGPKHYEPNDDGRQREWVLIQDLFDRMEQAVSATLTEHPKTR